MGTHNPKCWQSMGELLLILTRAVINAHGHMRQVSGRQRFKSTIWQHLSLDRRCQETVNSVIKLVAKVESVSRQPSCKKDAHVREGIVSFANLKALTSIAFCDQIAWKRALTGSRGRICTQPMPSTKMQMSHVVTAKFPWQIEFNDIPKVSSYPIPFDPALLGRLF